ncbi:glycine cleavage system protein GcvH [Actinoplanes sp. NPDC026670]|uniref:glycine cleavage system protein GcvH n=1 Tax=Actinoplanes sp. NPDC026670 TaxID=3154700 RepID=UPI0033CD49C7
MRFTKDHEWLTDGEIATVGITAFAADALGDVIYVDLPEAGTIVAAGEPAGELESTKSVSEVYAPADGEIVEVNTALTGNPGLINTDPYGEGWLFRLRVTSVPATLDESAYQALVNAAS